MKYFGLFFMMVLLFGFWFWIQQEDPILAEKSKNEPRKHQNTGIKWHDSLFKHLPKNMDTSIVIFDLNLTPLKFSQYVKTVFNHEAIIYQDRGQWRLHRLTKNAHDSLIKDDFAVASKEKRAAYLEVDTIKSWKTKLDNMTNVLARADYVLVLKSKRKLYLYKKGKQIQSFNINLGWAPVGNKVSEGDGKTPEGIYHLDDKYYRDDDFYASIKLSYPNFKDREIAQKRKVKAGYGILIHGTKQNKTKAKDWTAGCIALANKDIDTLFKYVGEGTLIEIRK